MVSIRGVIVLYFEAIHFHYRLQQFSTQYPAFCVNRVLQNAGCSIGNLTANDVKHRLGKLKLSLGNLEESNLHKKDRKVYFTKATLQRIRPQYKYPAINKLPFSEDKRG